MTAHERRHFPRVFVADSVTAISQGGSPGSNSPCYPTAESWPRGHGRDSAIEVREFFVKGPMGVAFDPIRPLQKNPGFYRGLLPRGAKSEEAHDPMALQVGRCKVRG